MNIVKLKDVHLGVLQFAHKEKDEIEDIASLDYFLGVVLPLLKLMPKTAGSSYRKGQIKVNSKSIHNS